MTISGKRTCRILVAVVIAVVGMTASSTRAITQGNPNPGVLPLNSKPFGNTYAEWSAAWCQWALATDGNENPIEDTDGRFASTGQNGKVWFLAGTSFTAGGQLVERSVTIPAGKAIFFPILNNVWLTVPYFGDPPFSEPGAEQVARDAVAVAPATDTLEVEIDGRPLTNLTSYRVQSPVFTAFLPDFNWYDVVFGFFGIPLDFTEGIYPDSVSDGYWIMLTPLSRGQHTIYFRGENSSGFVTEVLYHVTSE
jgi:hypothetical protein